MKDTDIKTQEEETPEAEVTPIVRDYLFPTQCVTIQATSKEEAETKLVELSQKIIINNK